MSTKLVIVGRSNAGISAGLRAKELDPKCEVTIVVADRFPNYSICRRPVPQNASRRVERSRSQLYSSPEQSLWDLVQMSTQAWVKSQERR